MGTIVPAHSCLLVDGDPRRAFAGSGSARSWPAGRRRSRLGEAEEMAQIESARDAIFQHPTAARTRCPLPYTPAALLARERQSEGRVNGEPLLAPSSHTVTVREGQRDEEAGRWERESQEAENLRKGIGLRTGESQGRVVRRIRMGPSPWSLLCLSYYFSPFFFYYYYIHMYIICYSALV